MKASWSIVGKYLEKIVPSVAKLLTGNVASSVGEIVANIIGVASDPDAVLERLKTDPEAAIKLQELENNNEQKLAELQLEETRIYLSDIASARNREIELTRILQQRDWNLTGLAWLVASGFFVITGILIFIDIPEASNSIAMLLLGALTAGFGTVLQYFFGSSKSSKDKDNILHNKRGQ